MRGIIVASSPYDVFEKLYEPLENDLIVGVDGGCKYIKSYKIDLAFGDFDSMDGPVNAKRVYHYPRQKKETDLELAIDAIKGDVDEILIYNATGGRLDHFLANLKLLERNSQTKITIVDEQNAISYIEEGVHILKKDNYKYFSLIANDECIISINNAMYNIDKKIIRGTDTFTVSNELLEEDVKITIYEGNMFLIKSSDK